MSYVLRASDPRDVTPKPQQVTAHSTFQGEGPFMHHLAPLLPVRNQRSTCLNSPGKFGFVWPWLPGPKLGALRHLTPTQPRPHGILQQETDQALRFLPLNLVFLCCPDCRDLPVTYHMGRINIPLIQRTRYRGADAETDTPRTGEGELLSTWTGRH